MPACWGEDTYAGQKISNNRLSLSEIWSLRKHENLTTGKKYCGKEEKLLLRSNFPSSPQHVQYISNFKSPITYLLNVINRIIFFLNSANLICRGTDISKYFRESLGIRDNESRCICNRKLHRSRILGFSRGWAGLHLPPPPPNNLSIEWFSYWRFFSCSSCFVCASVVPCSVYACFLIVIPRLSFFWCLGRAHPR